MCGIPHFYLNIIGALKLNKVKISKMNVVSEDHRGITAELNLPRHQSNFIYITRQQNTLSGNVYHEGKIDNMRPKILILLSGKINFIYRNLNETQITSREVISPSIIEIDPYVVHKVEAVEDFIALECFSIHDMEQDRIKQDV